MGKRPKNKQIEFAIRMIQSLQKREAEILVKRFIEKETQANVSKIYGVDRERVRQIENIAINKIVKYLDRYKQILKNKINEL